MAHTTTKTLPAAGQLGDLIKTIFHPAFNYESAIVIAPAGAVATPSVRLLGQPVVGAIGSGQFTLCLGGNIAAATGIIVDDGLHDMPAAGVTLPGKFAILVRGPAVVGAEALPAADVLATGITPAAFIARLATLNVAVMAPLSPTKVQST